MQTAVDIRRFSWIRRLASDYAYDFAALAPFFAGDPASPDAWRETIRRRHTHRHPPEAFVDALTVQLERREAPAEALAAAQRLRDSTAVAIVTGQQAGLFGGPLFTLLKAVTAIQLAEQITRDHEVQAVAVFWIDAEDHDWDEVGSCGVLDADLRRRSIALPPPAGAGHTPVAALRLDDNITTTLDQLEATLPPTEFTASLLTDLRRIYASGTGMTDAFGRLLEAVLGARGLVVFDSSDPAAKPFVGEVFAHEVRTAGRTAALAATAGAALVACGYHAQVTPQVNSVALFRMDGVREPIRYSANSFTVGEADYATATLAAEVAAVPARFSPNVLLRPIVQDTLFPTIGYVAGPSELAYLAQLKDIYGHFNVPMPLMYPRATATIIDSAAARFLNRSGLPLEALQPQDEAALNRLLASQLPPGVERSLAEATRALQDRLAAVIDAVPAVDPTLEGAARSTLGRMERDLRTLHNKVLHAAKRRDETLRRQFGHARALAFPDGNPQERTLGFVYFLNRYGPPLVDQLAADLPLDPRHHWVITS